MNALRVLGYEAVWQGERSGNGVAILARHHVPVLTCTSLPGNPEGECNAIKSRGFGPSSWLATMWRTVS